MIQQDKLFVLIKSLTSGEKTYFSKYSRVHHAKEKPDYLRLFEFIDTQEEYDEKAVIKHFKKEKFVKQLPRKKTQLKEKIIESLSIFHADRTVESSLRRQMVLLPVFYEKASQHKDLIKDYEKLIKDIKKTAEQHECFSVLIELFEWERWLSRLLDDNNREKKVFSLLDERKTIKAKLSQEIDIEDTATRLEIITLRDPRLRENLSRRKVESLSIQLLSQDEIDILSKRAKRKYYIVEEVYNLHQGRLDLSHKSAKSLLDTYDSAPSSFETSYLIEYKKHLCRYLVVSGFASKFDDYLDVIDKLIMVADDDIKIFNTVQFKLLVHYLNNSEFESAANTVKNIEERWTELATVISKERELAYHYNIIVAYWLAGNMDDAIHWLSKILNFEKRQVGQRFVNLSRIIQLPLYYDYDDKNLDNRIESTRKILNSKGELSEYRKIILSHFRKLIRCVSKQDKKECITDMQSKLTQIQSEKNIKSGDLGCVLFWCKEKVGDVEIREDVC